MLVDQKAVNTLRKLSLDQITRAKSGHPGVALGAAPIMYAIFKAGAKYVPNKPDWFNRDRIVLSGGHASSLLYSALHLFGFDLSIRDLKNFRKLNSKTPGHPEYGITPGVDVSTGGLGQGFANAVGFALAEAHIASMYNTDDIKICDHYTFAMCGDGDIMEGVCYESASIAGLLKLNKLIVLYDSNDITLDGSIGFSSNENVVERFKAMGWNVILVANGNDYLPIEKAILKAKKSKTKPTLIICKTTIGYGSELAGSHKCHGTPFNMEQTIGICDKLKVEEVPFEVDYSVSEYCKNVGKKYEKSEEEWVRLKELYKQKYRDKYDELFVKHDKKLCFALDKLEFTKDISTRQASGDILNAIADVEPLLIGGSADLTEATKMVIKKDGFITSTNFNTRNIAFGVREHAMVAISNGMALHGGLKPFVSTFLVFSDYCKYSIRMSAMMNLPLLYAFTHDSIAVGEDGATHQPVEHIQSLRLIPNLSVFRPADAIETIAGYKFWMLENKPTALILSRQSLPILQGSNIEKALKGGYIVSKEDGGTPKIVLVATGSEVSLCVEAQKKLQKSGISTRVVSIPCKEIFMQQPKNYIADVLGTCRRVVVEAGVTSGWEGIASTDGICIGINTFGRSGSKDDVQEFYGITVENIVKNAKKLVK